MQEKADFTPSSLADVVVVDVVLLIIFLHSLCSQKVEQSLAQTCMHLF